MSRVYIRNGERVHIARWTDSCSGCFEGGEYMGMAHHYPYDGKAGCHVGAGCHECGYTGKRRRVEYIPAEVA